MADSGPSDRGEAMFSELLLCGVSEVRECAQPPQCVRQKWAAFGCALYLVLTRGLVLNQVGVSRCSLSSGVFLEQKLRDALERSGATSSAAPGFLPHSHVAICRV
jgi:hypothetical protein